MVNLETIVSNKFILLVTNTCIFIPQIFENAINRTREGLNLKLAVGIFITQAIVPLQLYVFELNFTSLVSDRIWITIYICFFLLTFMILVLQKFIGPRFFLPKSLWNIGCFDYQQPCHIDEDYLCAICITGIDQGKHMWTPCEHLFHETCLRLVLDRNMDCPICWKRLPPDVS